MRLFATCARGLEPVLAEGLRLLGARDVCLGRGGVHFRGDQALLYRANLWLRTAIRVLRPILRAPVHSPQDLYEAVFRLDWSRYLTPDHTLAVDANVRDSAITHSQYAALRVKDAICDQCRQRWGRRPSVDVVQPLIPLNLHIYRNEAILSLDSSGRSLHKRGYRPIQTKAPLNEALAAALILLSGWRGKEPFFDPMCGSGTLPIEAAWLALHRPPGLTRRYFGFQGWLDFDRELWLAVRDEARRGLRSCLEAPIGGADVRGDAVAWARRNARAAGVGHLLQWQQRDIADFRPPEGPPGVLLCNPPYGHRLEATQDLSRLYRTLGQVLRQRCAGWRIFLLVARGAPLAALDLTPKRSWPLYNGPLRCQLLEFQIT
jgi:putative N6-adenine-specific DNA methylase